MPRFTVAELEEDRLGQAYSLVRAISPGTTLDGWLHYAETQKQRGGILGLFGSEWALFGMLTYRLEHTLRAGLILRVDDFVAFELSSAAAALGMLSAAAEALARDLGCSALEVRLQAGTCLTSCPPKTDAWIGLGHGVDALIMSKPLMSANPRPAAAPRKDAR